MRVYSRLIPIATLTLALAQAPSAQERLSSGAIEPTYAPGWTFTPTFGFAETYDDNISLFAVNTAEEQNNDYIATYFPAADLHYSGRHTLFNAGYTGSFLNYRTFTALNRWDQRGALDFRRQETAHIKWSLHGSGALVPSTEEIDLGGIPYRHTGARTLDGRAAMEYLANAHDSFQVATNFQVIDFERTANVDALFRGGHMFEALGSWRHRLDSRFAFGADYGLRRASVVGDVEQFNIHSAQAAVDYELSPAWSISAGGGIVYLQPTDTTQAHTGPAWSVSASRHQGHRTFRVEYLRSYLPAFGFGGTIQNEQVGAGFRTPLFGSRYWYTDQLVIFRNDIPLENTTLQLPLRSLRTYSVIGWEPQPWVRIEAFYARTQQTSLRAGGLLYRNRFGIQIVTSKPLRVQ